MVNNMMLNIFGLWVMSTAILGLKPYKPIFGDKNGCFLSYMEEYGGSFSARIKIIENVSCEQVANEINNKLKAK